MGPPPGLFVELGKWRDKAIRRGKATDFNSDIIPAWLHDELYETQKVYGPEAVFSFLKQVPRSVRMRAEREVQLALEDVLGEELEEALYAIEHEQRYEDEKLSNKLSGVILPIIASLILDSMMRLSVDIGIAFDPAIINTEALRWAREYTYKLVGGLTDTTRVQLQEAVAAFVQTPEMAIADLRKLIEPAFGSVRAEMIAITETTRAYSMAINRVQRLLQVQTPDLTVHRVWNTMKDERVCQICGPLESAPESEFSLQFPEGPPAHPNCRCGLELRFVGQDQLDKEYRRRQRERRAWLKEQGIEVNA